MHEDRASLEEQLLLLRSRGVTAAGSGGGAGSRVLPRPGGTPSGLLVPIHPPSPSPAAHKCPLCLLKGLGSAPAPMDVLKPSQTSNKTDKAQCLPVLPQRSRLQAAQTGHYIHSKSYKTFFTKITFLVFHIKIMPQHITSGAPAVHRWGAQGGGTGRARFTLQENQPQPEFHS